MRTRRHFDLGSAIIALVLAVMPAVAGAQTPGWISYAAKFVCGVQKGEPAEQPIVNGKYRTAVNIHNPHYLFNDLGLAPVDFFKKVVLALPQGERFVRPSCHELERLPADHALTVNCANIRALLTLSGIIVPNPFEGFVVLEVPPQAFAGEVAPELDVTVVYTARHRPGTGADVVDYDVQTIDVETVTPKRILGDPVQFPCDQLR